MGRAWPCLCLKERGLFLPQQKCVENQALAEAPGKGKEEWTDKLLPSTALGQCEACRSAQPLGRGYLGTAYCPVRARVRKEGLVSLTVMVWILNVPQCHMCWKFCHNDTSF